MQATQLRKANAETGQLKQAEAANSAQLLEQERQKTAAVAQEAAAARQELTASTAEHRQALDEERLRSAALASELATAQRESEMQATQLRKASEETEQLKQATERAMTDLRRSLQQERDRNEAMARDIECARRTIDVRATPEPTVNSISNAAAGPLNENAGSGPDEGLWASSALKFADANAEFVPRSGEKTKESPARAEAAGMLTAAWAVGTPITPSPLRSWWNLVSAVSSVVLVPDPRPPSEM
jgi:hypothetical protein